MTLATDLATAQDETFRGRVLMAAVRAAVAIANEEPAATDDAVTSRRHALAFTMLNNPSDFQERFVWAVLTNPAVSTAGAEAPDGDIEFVVSSVWNAIAGTNLAPLTLV